MAEVDLNLPNWPQQITNHTSPNVMWQNKYCVSKYHINIPGSFVGKGLQQCFLNVPKCAIVSLIFLQAFSFWPLFLNINERQRGNETGREGMRQLERTVHFALKWKHWTRMNESRLSSHSLEQIRVCPHLSIDCMRLCHRCIVVPFCIRAPSNIPF